MPFGIIGRTGPGMRQVVGFWDRCTGRGTFGGEFGAHYCPQGPIARTCATAQQRGTLPKLLWADLFLPILKLNVPSIARPIINWCVLADSLSEESVKELCSAAWNGDLYVDLKAMTVHKFTASL